MKISAINNFTNADKYRNSLIIRCKSDLNSSYILCKKHEPTLGFYHFLQGIEKIGKIFYLDVYLHQKYKFNEQVDCIEIEKNLKKMGHSYKSILENTLELFNLQASRLNDILSLDEDNEYKVNKNTQKIIQIMKNLINRFAPQIKEYHENIEFYKAKIKEEKEFSLSKLMDILNNEALLRKERKNLKIKNDSLAFSIISTLTFYLSSIKGMLSIPFYFYYLIESVKLFQFYGKFLTHEFVQMLRYPICSGKSVTIARDSPIVKLTVKDMNILRNFFKHRSKVEKDIIYSYLKEAPKNERKK